MSGPGLVSNVMDMLGASSQPAQMSGNPQGDDILRVLDEAAGRPLDPSEIEAFLRSPQGDYVMKNYDAAGGIDENLKPAIMNAFDDWSKTTKTVPDDMMGGSQSPGIEPVSR